MDVKRTQIEHSRNNATDEAHEANGLLWLTLSVVLFVLILLPVFT